MDIIKKQFFKKSKKGMEVERRSEAMRGHAIPLLHHLSGLISSFQLEGAPALSPRLPSWVGRHSRSWNINSC